VVDHEVDDQADAALPELEAEVGEVAEAAEAGIDGVVVGDVVAVVEVGRGMEGLQPDAVHPQVLQVVDALGQAREVADPVAVRVHEGLDVEIVDDGVLVPHGGCPPRGSRLLNPERQPPVPQAGC
jgi:hypothetical protein